MRRMFLLCLFTVAAVALAVSPASAGTITAHSDPDDTRSRPDIRKVWTDRADGVFVQIATWDHLSDRDGFNILFDTRGSRRYDRVVELGTVVQQNCLVSEIDADGTLGAPIGTRHAHRPGGRKIRCRFPTGWLDITKAVRFKARSDIVGGEYDDLAPNHGRFVGL
jgi:hypothetical protein